MLDEGARKVCGGGVGDEGCAHCDSDHECDERKLSDTKAPAALLFEADGVLVSMISGSATNIWRDTRLTASKSRYKMP